MRRLIALFQFALLVAVGVGSACVVSSKLDGPPVCHTHP